MNVLSSKTGKRIVTAFILSVLFVLLVLKSSSELFALVTIVIVFAASFEWAKLVGFGSKLAALAYSFVLLSIILLLMIFGAYKISGVLPVPNATNLYAYIAPGVFTAIFILPVAVAWWLLAIPFVIFYPLGVRFWGRSSVVGSLIGIITLISCWSAINYIRIFFVNGRVTLLFVFILIWATDIGAWFFGKNWGNKKILPLVSPGKTWMGLFGGISLAFFVTLIAIYYSKTPLNFWPGAIILCLLTVIFAIFGDLFESILKRNAGVKDSGNCLPGHGGLLDRIDSLLAAAPIFVFGSMVLDRILH